MKSQQIENCINTIGCNKQEFLSILNQYEGKFNFSSGSYYEPYYIFIDSKLIMKYDNKGKLIYKV